MSVSGNLKDSVSSASGGWRSGNWEGHKLGSDNERRRHYLFENFDLHLRLRRTVRIVPPTVNEGLKVLAVFHLRVVLFLQVSVTLGFR